MSVRQISIFLENRAGRLAEVCRILGENSLNIRALSIADTTDFGILRLIVNDPARAMEVLHRHDFAVSETEVIAVEVPDHPGGLAGILETMQGEGLNIEYMYAFVQKASKDALVIMRVEDADKAARVLSEKGVGVLDGARVYSL